MRNCVVRGSVLEKLGLVMNGELGLFWRIRFFYKITLGKIWIYQTAIKQTRRVESMLRINWLDSNVRDEKIDSDDSDEVYEEYLSS